MYICPHMKKPNVFVILYSLRCCEANFFQMLWELNWPVMQKITISNG